MTRVLGIFAFAVLAGCAAQGAYSGGTASTQAPSPSGQMAVEPSGLSSEQVRLVQRSLADRGFAVNLTGTFDDRTQTALTDFQRARGLAASGSLDASTIDALGIDPRDVTPVIGEDPDFEEQVHGTAGG